MNMYFGSSVSASVSRATSVLRLRKRGSADISNSLDIQRRQPIACLPPATRGEVVQVVLQSFHCDFYTALTGLPVNSNNVPSRPRNPSFVVHDAKKIPQQINCPGDF